ncbi:15044_t:CDS:1, partial [Racocetra persica]
LQRHQLFLPIPTGVENPMQQRWQEYSQQFNSWPAHQQTTALDEISSLLQEPAIVVQDSWEQHTRGRPVGARNAQSSTRRDPSAFELAEPGRRKCVLCHRTGHNHRTCPNNNKQN